MAELTLKSRRFREERESQWRTLEGLLARAERGSAARLSDDEILALPALYRSALSSLSVARAISLDRSLVAYLESLCARAYFCVYGPRTTILSRAVQFFRTDWPWAVRDLWRETLAAILLTVLGTAVAYILTLHDPTWFYAFVPDGLVQGREPTASAAALREPLFHPAGNFLFAFATLLFTHNAQIALFAFALGFAFCLPAAFAVFYNGLTLGAFIAVYISHGLGVDFGGWLLIHGTTELFAIALAGAAGIRLGWTLAFPGGRSRAEAMSAAGKATATMMAGTIVMLGVAGILEGIARQLVVETPIRYAIAIGALLFWVFYFYLPRDVSDHGGN